MPPRLIPARVRPVARAVVRIPWLEDELTLLPRLVPRGGACMDVGAANGIYTTVLSRVVGPRGRVYAVEPQSFSFRVLDTVRRGLRLRNVEARQLAISDTAGATEMLVPARRFAVHGRAFVADGAAVGHDDLAEFRDAHRLLVATVTLDAFVAARGMRRLDFVKCDVEGAELRVLRSGEDTLRRFRPVLLLEVEARHTRKYGYSPADLFAWLADRGYSAAVLHDGVLRPVTATVDGVRNYVFRPTQAAEQSPSWAIAPT